MKKLIIFAILFRIFFVFWTWHPDVNNHIDWGIRFYDYGASEFYEPDSNVWSYTWPNQPPGTIYLYAAIYKIFQFIFNIFWQINLLVPLFPSIIITFFESNLYPALLQMPSILADFGIAYLIYKIVYNLAKKEKKQLAKWGALAFLFNPVVLYNSSVWGQTDALISFFVLLSFYLLLKKKPIFAAIAFAISLYIKISLAIFIPIWAIYAIRQKYSMRKYFLSIIIPLSLVIAATLPFSSDPLYLFQRIYMQKVLIQQLHVITANAFNLWAFIAGIHEQPNSLPFLGLTYRAWGNILFTASFLPLLYILFKKKSKEILIWVLALAAFSSFMLLTNMHERYLYPFFPYATILAALYPNLRKYYWSISFISLLNLYNFWWKPRIEPIVALMSAADRASARLLGLISFGIYVSLYKKFADKFV